MHYLTIQLECQKSEGTIQWYYFVKITVNSRLTIKNNSLTRSCFLVHVLPVLNERPSELKKYSTTVLRYEKAAYSANKLYTTNKNVQWLFDDGKE